MNSVQIPDPMPILLRASVFAEKAHGTQEYAGHPYSFHLRQVAQVLIDSGFGGDDGLLAAAYLHDVVEDTGVNIAEIKEKFGDRVAELVWACSGFGVNRKERNADIAEKLQRWPGACVLKVADRTANVENGISENHDYCGMYAKEREPFEDLVRDHVPPEMFARLVRAHDRAAEVAAEKRSAGKTINDQPNV